MRSIRALEADVKRDDARNKTVQISQRGSKVEYGQLIQLQHVYTDKFLSVSDTDTAYLGVQLAAQLQTHSDASTVFKILPRYKVRSVGQPVITGDDILLQSLSSSGQYLDCTDTKFEPINEQLGKFNFGGGRFHQVGDYEASASANQRSWKITIMELATKRTPADPNTSATLHHGDIVQFVHKETDNLLILDKDNAANYSAKLEDGEVDKNYYDSFWQVCCHVTSTKDPNEEALNRLNGGPVEWTRSRVCFRHLLTGRYLGGGVPTTSTKNALTACWRQKEAS